MAFSPVKQLPDLKSNHIQSMGYCKSFVCFIIFAINDGA